MNCSAWPRPCGMSPVALPKRRISSPSCWRSASCAPAPLPPGMPWPWPSPMPSCWPSPGCWPGCWPRWRRKVSCSNCCCCCMILPRSFSIAGPGRCPGRASACPSAGSPACSAIAGASAGPNSRAPFCAMRRAWFSISFRSCCESCSELGSSWPISMPFCMACWQLLLHLAQIFVHRLLQLVHQALDLLVRGAARQGLFELALQPAQLAHRHADAAVLERERGVPHQLQDVGELFLLHRVGGDALDREIERQEGGDAVVEGVRLASSAAPAGARPAGRWRRHPAPGACAAR